MEVGCISAAEDYILAHQHYTSMKKQKKKYRPAMSTYPKFQDIVIVRKPPQLQGMT
jgi:hypothetical protein